MGSMSGLNCKPGDLAIVVRGDTALTKSAIGIVLRVSRIDSDSSTLGGTPMWELDRLYRTETGLFNRAADRILKPIRPQSDDAVDEMVKLVGIAPMTAAEVLAWSEA
jgi:hypothetical protein